jgi:NTP pyrophosphohydrolases containing a Zn-finger, probably nucleic-acid-binding
MPSDIIYKRYVPGVVPPEDYNGKSWWFVFYTDKLMYINSDNKVNIPFFKDLEELNIKPIRKQYLGMLEGHCCYSAEIDYEITDMEDISFSGLRLLYGLLEEDTFMLAGKAFHIVNWDRTHQFCGRCGTKTEYMQNERAKLCPKCGFASFTRISPAVITAVFKGEKILLAHSKRFKPNLYSLVAGFVEPGETMEDCVKREIMEEVGIKVKNIKYFASQPWPFPDSLMVGFTAEYESGEVKADGVEITDAGWYDKDMLPLLPAKDSIARKIIDWYIENH